MSIRYTKNPKPRRRGGAEVAVGAPLAIGFEVVERDGFFHCMRAPWGEWMTLSHARKYSRFLDREMALAAGTLAGIQGFPAARAWLKCVVQVRTLGLGFLPPRSEACMALERERCDFEAREDAKRCRRCGGEVEPSRRFYVVPTCFGCLPPPRPLPVVPFPLARVLEDAKVFSADDLDDLAAMRDANASARSAASLGDGENGE